MATRNPRLVLVTVVILAIVVLVGGIYGMTSTSSTGQQFFILLACFAALAGLNHLLRMVTSPSSTI